MSVNLIILGEEVQERGLNLSAMLSVYMKQDPFIPSALCLFGFAYLCQSRLFD